MLQMLLARMSEVRRFDLSFFVTLFNRSRARATSATWQDVKALSSAKWTHHDQW